MDRRAAEDLPYVFIGLPSAITGPYDNVVLPSWAQKPDWELELAAVIGRPAHRVSVEQALDHVAGYTIANDLTGPGHRLPQGHAADRYGLATRSKNAPGFTPLGPWIVPAASITDPAGLRLTLKLNGETMQDESTKDMIFDVARMVSYASQTARLLPGDLVLTGSQAGNGMHWGRLLRDGDVMDGAITDSAPGTPLHRGGGGVVTPDRAGPAGPHDPEGAIAAAAKAYSNWGRWGEDDRLGTLNFLDEAKRREGAALVRRGVSFSLSQRFDMDGPQRGWRRRTNPVHTMLKAAWTPHWPTSFPRPRRLRRRDRHAAPVLHPVGRPRAHLRPRRRLERPRRGGGRHLRR
ncbi:hypothetical protein SALBM135S_03688 [Streptomyces alboniger]